MDELISRQAALKLFTETPTYTIFCGTAEKMINALPAIKPKTGRWIWWTDDRKDYAKCSECCFGEEGEIFWRDITNYCPNCGARMEAEQ